MRTFTQPQTTATPGHREALLKMKSEVMANLGVKFNTIASMPRVNEEDQAQQSHEESVQLRLNSLDYNKLRQVDAALDRLDDGEYGVCMACEEQIPARRLQIIPWAKYCVACQERIGNGDLPEEDPASLFAHFATR